MTCRLFLNTLPINPEHCCDHKNLTFPFWILMACGTVLGAQTPPESHQGYPDEGQPEFDVTDPEEDLDNTFPQDGSVFGEIGTSKYFGWKENLYEQTGLKIGVSLQMLYQHTSATSPLANHDSAFGYWYGITTKWTLINRGEDYEGSLVVNANERQNFSGHAVPAQFGAADVGLIWSNFEFTQWDFSVEDLYWEQWLEKDRFMMRVGNQIPTVLMNSFRFKDARTSFTASPFAFHETIPYPTYGLGVAFKYWSPDGGDFYVVGTLNDMNGDPNVRGLDWSTFSRGEYFYGIEIGYYWRREGGEFDHVFLDVFYADERSTRSPDTFPNEAGGGFKVSGSKQSGKLVYFASYTHNTAEGGGISVTFASDTITAGVVRLDPFGVEGEFGIGLMYSKPLDLIEDRDLRSQYGTDIYWKMLLTPNLWLTPGFQLVWNPTLNPTEDFVFIPHIKFRVSY